MIVAFAPPKVPPQAGNPPLDARTPAVPLFPPTRALQRLSFLRELAGGWDRHQLDSGGRELRLGLWGMHPPVACHQVGGMLKKRLVMGHRFDRLPMLVWVLQNLVACHDPAIDFIQDHLAAKFDQRAAFMAGDWAGGAAQKAGDFFF